ncbi:uncharacterized protein LOC124658460 isoform X2 [Lolium rigidum]|uniref:uncharacterized protein LOC124658460 isoform X2 n=1 Tax=Lolium rigidum TaxID=89674 RepID=UPI001F5D447A|nr:uncharacterized protein LOC124658460 isoform X2 [Lolium rigidum]
MLKVKRRTRGSDGSRKLRKRGVKEVSTIFSDLGEGMTENLGREVSRTPSDLGEGMPENLSQEVSSIWSDLGECMTENLSQELSEKLSPSIVLLASFHGDKMHYRCTGIVIEERPYGPTILTSLNLVTTTDDKRKVIRPSPKIKVCLPNNEVVTGWLKHLNLRCNMVVVTTTFYPDLRAVHLSNNMQVGSHTKAVKRCFNSGKLLASSGVLIDRPSGVGYEGNMLSTCEITQDGSGGPLIDFDGNIIGMNEYLDSGMTRYIPTDQLLEHLRKVGLCKNRGEAQPRLTRRPEGFSSVLQVASESSTSGSDEENELDEPQEYTGDKCKHLRIVDPWPSDDFTAVVNKSLGSDGYPLPKYADGGMHLEGDFEEEFSRDSWRKRTRKRIASKMSQSVVALASFSDKGRYFACSGVLIDCGQSIRILTSANLVRNGGKTEKNLRIEVCLPNRERKAGILQHCNLQYNVAIVSIMDFRGNRPAKFVEETQTKVVALGRVFKSGKFMATRGVVTGKQSRFDCKELKISKCKITKAGIGGPLVDFNGDIVGMNFYDTEETPYLPSNIILILLRQFDLRGTVTPGAAEEDACNSWPVPDPFWYYPSLHCARDYAVVKHLL